MDFGRQERCHLCGAPVEAWENHAKAHPAWAMWLGSALYRWAYRTEGLAFALWRVTR